MINACSSPKESSPPEADVPSRRLPLPAGIAGVGTVAWLKAGTIAVEASYRIWVQDGGADKWHRLEVKNNERCTSSSYYQLSALPDGRLGMLCAVGITNGQVQEVMVGYDFNSHVFAPLLSEPVPGPGDYSWNSDMSRGVFSTTGSYSTLYWLTPFGISPLTVTLTKEDKSWKLSDSLTALDDYNRSVERTGREVHPVGNTGAVAWSPDGRYIAFWATLEPIGRPYHPLMVMAWDLYLLEPKTLRVERILEQVYDAGSLAWSSDGQWLAYTSGKVRSQPEGLWLLSRQTGQKILLKNGHFGSVTWSPDGPTIMATRCLNGSCMEAEIWQYDLRRLLASMK